ncbi:4-hydroxythreonine-4-phosphate dehydrogenase PdxA [Gracilimonas amylolytica]|uniref:4-hydroxythreonine-4-phosphate dehydrogenase PdxA n=1 Tax=Gracilimonas amylolytica TaxID=1749045 RepID=UPI000CD925E3|nr:4-hydroxythreonine-4-phosphate dehydrogenase PdxA [Gracilimonas amylolytica]
MQSEIKPKIAISIGDFNGIGPEVVLKSVSSALHTSTPVIIAPVGVIEYYKELLNQDINFNVLNEDLDIHTDEINVYPIQTNNLSITPGTLSKESGKVAMQAIETGIQFCLEHKTDALVTAPISKESVNLAGYDIPGHTEFLASSTDTESVLMMLVSGSLRVALVTTHIPIKDVAKSIDPELIKDKVDLLAKSLIKDFGIREPRIAVFGLNPHAGDGGVIGREELDMIIPTLKEINDSYESVQVNGPYPADGFFGQKMYENYDGILAMYHDQGLAPFKLLSFGKGVNFTAGLPIIRTSPDHGTAFNIAGKGVANPSSFKEAYDLAVELSNKKLREN